MGKLVIRLTEVKHNAVLIFVVSSVVDISTAIILIIIIL